MRKIPKFENETDEARWWFERRNDVGDDIINASQTGNNGIGSKGRFFKKVLHNTYLSLFFETNLIRTIGIIWLTICTSVIGALAYIIIHFIRKFW